MAHLNRKQEGRARYNTKQNYDATQNRTMVRSSPKQAERVRYNTKQNYDATQTELWHVQVESKKEEQDTKQNCN